MAIPKLTQIIPINVNSQTLNTTDTSFVSSNVQENNFNVDTDLIDAYVYNVNNALIRKITTQYSVLDTKTSGSEIKSLYIDPIKDLIPVCPNCHSMIHSKRPAFTIDEINEIRKNYL